MRWADLCAWTDPATRKRAMKDAAIRRMRAYDGSGAVLVAIVKEDSAIPMAIRNWMVSSLDVLTGREDGAATTRTTATTAVAHAPRAALHSLCLLKIPYVLPPLMFESSLDTLRA